MSTLERFAPAPARSRGSGRFFYVVAGPYGTGKSTLLGQMAQYGKLLVIATSARELKSWKYQQYNPDTVLLEDKNWYAMDGESGQLPRDVQVTMFDQFLKITQALLDDDEYDFIAVDSGTELGEGAWHMAMLPHNCIAPAYIEDKKSRWLPYETLATVMNQAVKNAAALTTTARRPKTVGMSWHIQPQKEDAVEYVGAGDQRIKVEKRSADHAAEGVEYEGKILPMVRGQFRRQLGSQVDAMIFTDIRKTHGAGLSQSAGLNLDYVLQVRSDLERHVKLPGPVPADFYVENNFEVLKGLVEAGLDAETEHKAPVPSELRGGGGKPAKEPPRSSLRRR